MKSDFKRHLNVLYFIWELDTNLANNGMVEKSTRTAEVWLHDFCRALIISGKSITRVDFQSLMQPAKQVSGVKFRL